MTKRGKQAGLVPSDPSYFTADVEAGIHDFPRTDRLLPGLLTFIHPPFTLLPPRCHWSVCSGPS